MNNSAEFGNRTSFLVKKKGRSISGEGLFFSLTMAQHIERNQEATIYIGNLDERCTDSLVWELMLQAGPVGMFFFVLF